MHNVHTTQGTLFYTIFKGDKIAETLNQLGFGKVTRMDYLTRD